jgi:competence protein ComEC
MVPRAVPPLVGCSLWALPTAVLTPIALPLGALLAAAGVLFALSRAPHRRTGLASLPVFLASLAPPLPPAPPLPAGPVQVDGIVRSVQRAPETHSLRIVLGDERAAVRVQLDDELEVLAGDRLRVLAHSAPPPAPGVAATLHGVAATARCTPGSWSLPRAASALHRAFERELLQRVPGTDGALLATLVLGRDTKPANDVAAAHRATGLSHLLAVSGAHAAMLAYLLGAGGSRRRVLANPRRTRAVLVVLVVYGMITGGEPPVLRAVFAFAIAAVATQLGRPCGLAAALLAPAVLTAFVQPVALVGPSFLLSYAAVAGLWLAGAPHGATRLQRWLWAPLRASVWATLMTAPITLWFFGQLAPCTVLLTPLLAPLVGVLLLGGLTLAASGLVLPWLAGALAGPVGALAAFYSACVRLADELPATPLLATTAVPPWVLGLALLAAASLLLWWPIRRAAAAAALLLVLPHFVPLPHRDEDGVQLFAIGHGQACLVTTASGHHCAIDCGSLQLPHLACEKLVQALPHRELDLLVITHADQDHHNGVPGLLAHCRVLRALVPRGLADDPLTALLRANGCDVAVLQPGESAAPAPHLRVHAPPVPANASDNDQSLWVSVALPTAHVLFTGDAQEHGLAAAFAAGLAVPHDVLVLPHHGRANANAGELLARVRPRACLASAASADGETLLAPLVRARGAELWVTGVHGSLHLFGDPARITGDAAGRPLAPAR